MGASTTPLQPIYALRRGVQVATVYELAETVDI